MYVKEKDIPKDIRKEEPSPLFDLILEVTPTHSIFVHRRIVCKKSKLLEMLLRREQELIDPNKIVQNLQIQLPTDSSDGEENELIEKELLKYLDQCLDVMYEQKCEMSTELVNMAKFLMMDPDDVLQRWAKGLSETEPLSSSDLQFIKYIIEDVNYLNCKTVKNLISYYGHQIIQQCNIPQEFLDELVIHGVAMDSHEKLIQYLRYYRSPLVDKVSSEYANVGLFKIAFTYKPIKFCCLGVEWVLYRNDCANDGEMLVLCVDKDFKLKSPLNVRVFFIVHQFEHKVTVQMSEACLSEHKRYSVSESSNKQRGNIKVSLLMEKLPDDIETSKLHYW